MAHAQEFPKRCYRDRASACKEREGIDRAACAEPEQFAAGVDRVFVNGVMNPEAGATTVKRAGRSVRSAKANA